MRKCCNKIRYSIGGGGVSLLIESEFSAATVVLSYMILTHNFAILGGGNLAAVLFGNGVVNLLSATVLSHMDMQNMVVVE